MAPLPDGRGLKLSAAVDVTERNQLNEEIRLNHEIVNSIKEGVVLVRAEDGVIVHANPQAVAMFKQLDWLTGHPGSPPSMLRPVAAILLTALVLSVLIALLAAAAHHRSTIRRP